MRRLCCSVCSRWFDVTDAVGRVCSVQCFETQQSREREKRAIVDAANAREIAAKQAQRGARRAARKAKRAAQLNRPAPSPTSLRGRRLEVAKLPLAELLLISEKWKRKNARFYHGLLEKKLRDRLLQVPTVEARTVGGPENWGFYGTPEWRKLRYRVIKQRGRRCEACGSTTKTIHVDHIKPRAKYPHLALEESNLQVLCVDCNMGKGSWDETDWRMKEGVSI